MTFPLRLPSYFRKVPNEDYVILKIFEKNYHVTNLCIVNQSS